MRFLTPRRPPSWGLLIASAIFAALALHGLATGELYSPGGRVSQGEVIFESDDPIRYFRTLHLQLIFSGFFAILGFVRVAILEDWVSRAQGALNAKMKTDRTPAPWWGYGILVGFIAFVIWIGWITMYSE